MRFLITAGPTREYIDDVRFLSNASSGRMGYAIARAAARRGHAVHLISGPTDLPDPPGARVTRVTSTQEMYEAAARLFPSADCLIGAAAPADYTPVRRVRGKAKKTGQALALRLKPTTDILAALGRAKRKQVIIAFALEVQSPVANALLKLRKKNADAIVLNAPAAMGATRSSATILLRDGICITMKGASKERIGHTLVRLAESLRGSLMAGISPQATQKAWNCRAGISVHTRA